MKESLLPPAASRHNLSYRPLPGRAVSLVRMKTLLSVAALISLALMAPISGAAANTIWLPNVTDSPTRFSAPGVYTGAPDLPLTLSMILAGGGPEHFATVPLVTALAGSKTDAEIEALKKKFGDQAVAAFVTILPFAVDDSLRIVKQKGIALPSTPIQIPKTAKPSRARFGLPARPATALMSRYCLTERSRTEFTSK